VPKKEEEKRFVPFKMDNGTEFNPQDLEQGNN